MHFIFEKKDLYTEFDPDDSCSNFPRHKPLSKQQITKTLSGPVVRDFVYLHHSRYVVVIAIPVGTFGSFGVNVSFVLLLRRISIWCYIFNTIIAKWNNCRGSFVAHCHNKFRYLFFSLPFLFLSLKISLFLPLLPLYFLIFLLRLFFSSFIYLFVFFVFRLFS